MEIEESQNYKNKEDLPWVEKYRPKDLSQLLSHKKTIKTLKNYMDGDNFPNLLMYGSAGTGKTSTIVACARKMYGSIYKYMVLELNASDDRGIKVIRDRIKIFAETSPPIKVDKFYFKLIILDEADSMTKDAQAALRRMMERYSRNTRFCFICNYATNIIPAIQSRCTRFKFKHVPLEDSINRICEISKLEGLNLSRKIVGEVIKICEGDLRKTINLLQNLYLLNSHDSSALSKMTIDDLYNRFGILSPEIVKSIFEILLNDDFENAHEKVFKIMQTNDADLGSLIPRLTELVQEYDMQNNNLKINLFTALAEVELRVSMSLNRDLTIDYLISRFVDERNMANSD